MCQCRLNTSDSCPPGKFGVKARTGRVKDQVVVTQTRKALSCKSPGGLFDREEKWKERVAQIGEREQGREKPSMTDFKKRRERRGGKVSKQAL